MNDSRGRRIAIRILLATAALAVGLVAFEGALRAFAPQPLVTPVNESFLGVAAPTAGMRGRVTLPGQYDTFVSIGSDHFRLAGAVDAPAGADTMRIAMLGDSVTFGIGADDGQTYPAQVERVLNATTPHGAPTVEVINAGVVGTGTGEQTVWYERWVRRFRPQIVVLNVFFNDIDDDRERGLMTRTADGGVAPAASAPIAAPRLGFVRHVPGYAYLAAHSHVAALVRVAGSKLSAGGAARASAAPPPYGRQSFVAEGLVMQSSEILFLRNRVAADGARLIVVSIPVRQLVYRGDPPDGDAGWKSETIARSLETLCAREGIPFLDVTGGLRERAAGGRLYFLADSHPTPRGYRAIAEITGRFIDAQLP